MKQQSKVRLNDPRFWLLGVAVLLMAFNWYLVEYNSVYLLFWCAALFITWRNNHNLTFDSNIFSTIIGLVLIIWLLFRGVVADNYADLITRMYPLLSLASICLLSTKVSEILQYWREIIIVSLTGIPWEHIFSIISPTETISIIDAKVARLLLWYVGFDAYQQDNLVILPTGSIQIAGPCSSFDLLRLTWEFYIVICLCFAIKRHQKILLYLWSTFIALVVNAIRLCLMALLIANDRQEAFDYWHGSAGAEIFTTIAILLLAMVYWVFIEEKTKLFGDP